jgi:molybdopterin molybdotransferase
MSSALPSYAEAAAIVAARAAQLAHSQPAVQQVDLSAAASRVLAQPLLADTDQPPFARSTRDGFACRASEINRHRSQPIAGATRAGEVPSGPLPPCAVWKIMTGAPVPAGADAVVMLEHVETTPSGIRLLPTRKISPGENIVPQGAQARRGDQLVPAGPLITYAQIALAACCGYASLNVFARPKVAILTTGDELVPIDAQPAPGQIRNSNAPMLAALVSAAGGDPWILPTARDNHESLAAALAQAAQADLLLLSGGVSAGKFDLVEPALAQLGATFHFTGVRIQPGKPLVFGELPGLPFFGLPGNPVSSAVTFLLFATPILSALAGSHAPAPRFALARLAADTDRRTKPGLTRFLPAFCTFNPPPGRLPSVELVPWQGSGDLAAQARSNCFLVIPEDTAALHADQTVQILLS